VMKSDPKSTRRQQRQEVTRRGCTTINDPRSPARRLSRTRCLQTVGNRRNLKLIKPGDCVLTRQHPRRLSRGAGYRRGSRRAERRIIGLDLLPMGLSRA
jgi:hypothetical protein